MNIKKIISVIVLISLLLIVCFGIAYALNLPTVDRFVPESARERIQLKRAQSYFPESIGTYKLFGESEKKVSIDSKCNKIEDNPILKVSGKTGDACMLTFVAEYREPVSVATSSIVRVSLSKFTKSADSLKSLVEKSTSPEALENKQVFRLSPIQIGWSPKLVFDMIVIQESYWVVGTSSIGTPFQKTTSSATNGNDAVTHYFLSKYAPGEVSSR